MTVRNYKTSRALAAIGAFSLCMGSLSMASLASAQEESAAPATDEEGMPQLSPEEEAARQAEKNAKPCGEDGLNTPEECAAREAANKAALAEAEAQAARNDANQQAYETRLSSYRSQMDLYGDTVESRKRAKAEYDQIKAAYDAAYAKWQADVAACNAGDHSRCSKAPPAQ
ncbi:MAG: hypothetical protein R3E02_15560 [Blastomonas sp.]